MYKFIAQKEIRRKGGTQKDRKRNTSAERNKNNEREKKIQIGQHKFA